MGRRFSLISKETVDFISPSHKFHLSRLVGYAPMAKKILLYDMMLFVNLVAEVPFACSQSDVDSFNNLYDFCVKSKVPPETYVACAYNYISKYASKGHKIHLGYFLNPKIIEYCGEHLNFTNTDSLIYQQILSEVLILEKSIRNLMAEDSISYDIAFKKQLRAKKLTPIYIAYKKHIGYSLLDSISFDGYLSTILSVLGPVFDFIMAKNGLYNPNKVDYWNNSKIEEFSFCPIMFRDRYLNKEFSNDYLKNAATDDGTKVHKLFEDVIDKYLKNKTKDFVKIYDKYINSVYYTSVKEQVSEHLKGVEDFFHTHIHKYLTKDSIIYSEKKLETLIEPHVNMGGTLDLLIVNGDTAHILDYKTSKINEYLAKNNEKYQKQLSLYAKLLQKIHPEVTNVDINVYYTRASMMVPLDVTQDIIESRVEQIKLIKMKIKLNNFTPNSKSCFLCMHPNCESRSKISIWAEDGTRR